MEAELFLDDKDSPEDIAEIQAARADYTAEDGMTTDSFAADGYKSLVLSSKLLAAAALHCWAGDYCQS